MSKLMYGTTPLDVLIKEKMLVERVNSSDLDWVFNQKGIGITLNRLGEFGSSLLESKRTFDDVCADVSLCNLLMTGGYGGWVMKALNLSPVATGKLVAGIVGLGNVADINAVTASSSTMAIVANSSPAMSVIAGSSVAMDSVLASSVAKTATLTTVSISEYKKKYNAMSKILANSAFVDSIRTTSVAKTALLSGKAVLTTVGSGNWTVPAGVSCITAIVIGGGANAPSNNSVGGAGGKLNQKAFNVAEGQIISYTVATGAQDSIFSDLSSSTGSGTQDGKLITKSSAGTNVYYANGAGGFGGGNGGPGWKYTGNGIGSAELGTGGGGGSGWYGSEPAGAGGGGYGGGGGGGSNPDYGKGGQGAIAIFM